MSKPKRELVRPVVDETGRLQGYRLLPEGVRKNAINRRAFLRGAGTVAIGLPFLEGLPERSAWAAGAQPVFTLLMVGSCGVVGKSFLPSAKGPLTTTGLSGATDRAVSKLSAHAANMLFVDNVNWVQGGPKSCGHAEGLVQSLTGAAPGSSGNGAYSSGPSADMVISKAVNASGTDPIALYSAAKPAYIADRISFKAAGAGQVRAGDQNPYILYSKLVGLTTTSPTTGGTTTDPVAAQLAANRKSVNDLVKAELNSLMNNSVLSADDKMRLDQHFQSIRDVEVQMGNMGLMCSTTGLDTTTLNSYKSSFSFKPNGMIEDVSLLHMQLVALAFACNYNRVATLQWGDGTDGTVYNVDANSRGWTFHQVSHRVQSDSAVGNDATAETAHHQIDLVRMTTLAKGLDAFASRNLASSAVVLWTTHISDGPSHSGKNVPHIIWGNGGGFLKTGQYIDGGGVTNNKMQNTLITAAIRDKSTAAVNFGMGTGTGMISGMLA